MTRILRLGSLLALVALPAHASYFDTVGCGTRGLSLSNALTAGATDYQSAYYNPAQLMARKHTHVGMGIDLLQPFVTVERRATSSTVASLLPERNLGFHVGVSTTFGGVFKDRVGFGFVLFVPILKLTRAESVDFSQPQLPMWQSTPDKLVILLGLAGTPIKWMRLGIGLQVLASLEGTADVNLSLVDQRVTRRRLTIDLHGTFAATAGMSFIPTKGLVIGLSYRQDIDLRYDLPIKALIEDVGLLQFHIDGTSLYNPHQLNFGVAWRLPWVPMRLLFDLTWAMWSKGPGLAPKTTLTIDNQRLLNDPKSTPQNLIDVTSTTPSLESRDVVIPRFGIEAMLPKGFTVRAGYAFKPTPLPTQRHQTNYVDSDTHVVSLGGSWTFADPLKVHKSPLTVGVGFQVAVLRERRFDKFDPNDPVGDYSVKGAVFNFGLDLQHDF